MPVFKMPVPVKIMGRSSSITNSFVNGIIPCIEPTENEIDEALSVLGMNRETACCAYCGSPHTEWDHLNPIVDDKQPTGYISEIHNLVPACSKCNQSKGNKDWKTWIYSDAQLSPKSKGTPDLDERVSRLKEYEATFEPRKFNFEEITGVELWSKHWDNYERIIDAMRLAQSTSDEIKKLIMENVGISVQRKPKQPNYVRAGNTNNQNESFPSNTEDEALLEESGIAKRDNETLQHYVQRSFCFLMKNSYIPDRELRDLSDKEYTNRVLGLNDRFLSRERWFDSSGNSRAWKDPYHGYYLCSEWNKRRFHIIEPKYRHWVAQMIRTGKMTNRA
ncbi:HNH endonuclease [Adlercreutzia sp. ZJ304]|uniref:HNH endonuclease n=1 Tax=Adlercreutzia sp. ZJ304 TaxID=2709791 RepID=UPI0013EC0241|nr:HNH endonuclease [Adlercreutzia sp. ZJ304]